MFFGESFSASLFIVGTVCLLGSLLQIYLFPRLSLFLSAIPIVGFFISSLFLDALACYVLAIGVFMEEHGATGKSKLIVMSIAAIVLVTLVVRWCVDSGGVKSTDL